MKNNTLGVIFASDNESHLNDLTLNRTTASLPFAGRYRLIDFVLSNFVEANITTIGIVAKNNYSSLMDHIRMGRDWNLNRKNSGIAVFPPFVLNSSHDIYKGKIEALYSLRNFMLNNKEEYVVITNSNIAFNIDFEDVEQFHLEKGADITVLTYKTTEINPRKHVVSVDKNDRITDIRYPIASDPEEQLANLNIYFIKKDLLISLIDNAYAHGAYDFEREILQKELDNLYIMSYQVKNYVAVIDRIHAYYKHSMGDFDLGFRISRGGNDIYVMPEYVGVCNDNPIEGSWQDRSLGIVKRIKLKESFKGLPFKDWFHYLNRNFGFATACVRSITPYIKIFVGK